MKNLNLILEEYFNAIHKFPKHPLSLFQAYAVLAEECGEVAKAMNNYFEGEGTLEDIKIETAQTGAMCLRLLETLEALEAREIKLREGGECL